jgi:hypothetical protein
MRRNRQVATELIHPTPWVQLGGICQIQRYYISLGHLHVPVSQLDAQRLALSFQNNDLSVFSYHGLLCVQNGSAQRQVSALY